MHLSWVMIKKIHILSCITLKKYVNETTNTEAICFAPFECISVDVLMYYISNYLEALYRLSPVFLQFISVFYSYRNVIKICCGSDVNGLGHKWHELGGNAFRPINSRYWHELRVNTLNRYNKEPCVIKRCQYECWRLRPEFPNVDIPGNRGGSPWGRHARNWFWFHWFYAPVSDTISNSGITAWLQSKPGK